MVKWLLTFMLVPTLALAQSTTGSIPGGNGGGGIPDPGCAASEIPARNPGNTAWVCTTNTSGGAPTNAGYWTSAADGTLSSEKNVGALGTGLVINTSGTPSIFAGTSCTNQFPRSISASGAATCASIDVAADVGAGTLAVARGGRGITTVTDDGIDVANGSLLQLKVLPDCTDSAGKHLNYDATSNAFSCGTTTSGGTGTGDVAGPASSGNNGVPLFDLTTGKILKQLPAGDGVMIVSGGIFQSIKALSGTGNTILTGAGPSMFQPTIIDYSNAQHNHQSGADGGLLDAGLVWASGTVPVQYGGTGSSTAATGTGGVCLAVSPVFTGIPQAPTAAAETTSEQIATTRYVQTELNQSQSVGTIQLTDIVTPGTCTNCNLTVDVDGRITAKSSSSTVTPGGATTNVQFNDVGTLSGNAGFTYNKTTGEVTSTGGFITTPNATSGQSIALFEDTDLGGSSWKLNLGSTNLAGDFSITPRTDGTLNATTLTGNIGQVRESCVDIDFTTSLVDRYMDWIPSEVTAGTLLRARCITTGTITTPPTIELDECAADGTSCSANTAGLTCDADGDTTTTFGGAAGSAVDANDLMFANMTGSVSVVLGHTRFCFTYVPQ